MLFHYVVSGATACQDLARCHSGILRYTLVDEPILRSPSKLSTTGDGVRIPSPLSLIKPLLTMFKLMLILVYRIL